MSAAVEYGVLHIGDIDGMIRLVAEAFSSSDPPALAMGLTAQDLERFLRIIAPPAAEAGLTTVARLRSTGEVIGAMLSDDLAMPLAADPELISRKFRPIFAMLEQLERQYFALQPPQEGEHVHLFMLAVDGRFAGRGIGQGLVQSCLENARTRGYRRAVTEATGAVSQHVFGKMGFQERARISYQEFQYEGKAVFSSIASHGGTLLMDRALP